MSASPLGRIPAKGVQLPARALRLRPRTDKGQETAPLRQGARATGRRPGSAPPGELVQIDHLTGSRNGNTLKPFKAPCPVSQHRVRGGTPGPPRTTPGGFPDVGAIRFLRPGPRAQRPALSSDRARGPGVSPARQPGRRRQRGPSRVRGGRPSTPTALGRAATEKPPAQRSRRTRPLECKHRVLELLPGRPHRQGRQRSPQPLPTLLPPCPPPPPYALDWETPLTYLRQYRRAEPT